MRIRVHEIEELFGEGASIHDAFVFIQASLEIMAKTLGSHYNLAFISPDCTEASIIIKIIRNLSSLYTLSSMRKDFIACATLCRSIVDEVAILKLIYICQDDKERDFRHYLYVLDGLRTREGLLQSDIQNNGRISEAVYNEIRSKAANRLNETRKAIEYCNEMLEQHEYFSLFHDFSKKAIDNAAWKYKATQLNTKGKVDQYSWKELYALLNESKIMPVFYSNYLSQFVHGLAMSNLPGQDTFENFELLFGACIHMQDIIKEELFSRFNKGTILTEGFTVEAVENIIAMYSPENKEKLMANYLRYKTEIQEENNINR